MKILFEWLRLLAVLAFGLFVVWLVAGCVAQREAAYYNPTAARRACPIPVCDGPCKEWRVLDCTSPSAIRGQRPPLTPGRP